MVLQRPPNQNPLIWKFRNRRPRGIIHIMVTNFEVPLEDPITELNSKRCKQIIQRGNISATWITNTLEKFQVIPRCYYLYLASTIAAYFHRKT